MTKDEWKRNIQGNWQLPWPKEIRDDPKKAEVQIVLLPREGYNTLNKKKKKVFVILRELVEASFQWNSLKCVTHPSAWAGVERAPGEERMTAFNKVSDFEVKWCLY
jgi:hypothetical protein